MDPLISGISSRPIQVFGETFFGDSADRNDPPLTSFFCARGIGDLALVGLLLFFESDSHVLDFALPTSKTVGTDDAISVFEGLDAGFASTRSAESILGLKVDNLLSCKSRAFRSRACSSSLAWLASCASFASWACGAENGCCRWRL